MPVLLDSEKLEKALRLVKNNPGSPQHVEELLKIMKPIFSLTRDRFPDHLGEDLEQELRMFIIRRADYMAKAHFDGRIKNITNYFFTVCRNCAINHMQKEMKNDDRLIPLADVKSEPIYNGSGTNKQRIIEQIRDEMTQWMKLRYKDDPEMMKKGNKFVAVFLTGKRPSFKDFKVKSFSNTDSQKAKDCYSVVLLRLRELVSEYMDELLE